MTALFTPRFSYELKFWRWADPPTRKIWEAEAPLEDKDSNEIPNGLSDCTIVNANYKQMLETLKLKNWEQTSVIELYEKIYDNSRECLRYDPRAVELFLADKQFKRLCEFIGRDTLVEIIHMLRVK